MWMENWFYSTLRYLNRHESGLVEEPKRISPRVRSHQRVFGSMVPKRKRGQHDFGEKKALTDTLWMNAGNDNTLIGFPLAELEERPTRGFILVRY